METPASELHTHWFRFQNFTISDTLLAIHFWCHDVIMSCDSQAANARLIVTIQCRLMLKIYYENNPYQLLQHLNARFTHCSPLWCLRPVQVTESGISSLKGNPLPTVLPSLGTTCTVYAACWPVWPMHACQAPRSRTSVTGQLSAFFLITPEPNTHWSRPTSRQCCKWVAGRPAVNLAY